ncbi:MAG: D-alanine--D-alanine ligase [Thermodesulfobacteria bacterium]|nr:D-alanine--D-alanine ligase [Thermodesulfobacteriota bacterium]
MPLRKDLKIALLAGGTSSEREVSLKGAKAVKKALEELGYEYEFFDPAKDLSELAKKAKTFDCAFLVLHGPGGEDGKIQGFLESIGLKYQGAGVLGSALAMHKGVAKTLYSSAGIKVPKGKTFFKTSDITEIVNFSKELGFPLVVKPASQGSSIGLYIVKNSEELEHACKSVWKIDSEVLIEEYLRGKEITVGVLENTALPVVEIIPKQSETFDYKTKYTPGLAEEICPAPISSFLTEKAQKIALKCHEVLKLRHYSRTDMLIIDDEVYVLETNTIPGMTETSLLPLAASTIGISFTNLVEKLISLALSS